MKTLIFCLSVFAIIAIHGCKKDSSNQPLNKCDLMSVSDFDRYDTADASNMQIVNVLIVDDCMHIEYASSGCSGDTWDLNLIDSGALITGGEVPERNLTFDFHNIEVCQAYVKKQTSFDLTSLRSNGSQRVKLNLQTDGNSYIYSY